MFPTAIIVFREVLEIALILTIVMAAIRELPGRFRLVGTGLGLGILGAVLIAFFTDSISEAIDGVGQEVFNATVMFIAVGLLSWTVIWMRRHGRELAHHLTQAGHEVVSGRKTPYTLIGVVAIATFREGAEIVLFLYGMISAKQYALPSVITGLGLGIGAGVVVGTMFYYGLLKTARKHIFTVTAWLLIILTASIAMQGTLFLIQAGLISELSPEIWDSSWLIAGDSVIGKVLHVLIGYSPRPTGMEALVYLSVLVIVGAGYFLSKPAPKSKALA